ncbi:hypothetical protein F1717_11320 [Micrococcus luteus]|uniref:GNAT family N-acetyltransferase n=1 Tax=Micrococcus luteus TaxID=1270 RepID=UPI0012DF7516|nr:hypothetical protein [Micrococcus luteus]QGS20717.1 hypothetical protein FOB85_00255 [Micrococcus luteus]QGY84287.1 hypothetical protein F1717_11320 [Micrococcus luteus]QHG60289.1 hypothetical protein FOF50_07255 [Micrococcus luteus]
MRPDHPAVGVLALGLARRLGLPDTALLPDDAPTAGAEPRRLEVARQGVAAAEVLALPWATVVAGPAWFTRACRGVPAEALGVESALLRTAVRAATGEAVRSRGEFTLYAAEEPPPVDPSRTVAVSHDPAHVHAVAARAPADDVAEAGVLSWESLAALVPDDGAGRAIEAPVAAAGYHVTGGVLASLGTLTPPSLRGRGLGRYAVAVAMDRAALEGLLPFAEVPADHTAAHHVAIAVGLEAAGTRTVLTLD